MKSKYTKTRPQNQLISHGRCVSIALTRSRYFPTRSEYIRFPSRPQQLSESRPVSDRAARSRTPEVGSAAPALVASRVHPALDCDGERLAARVLPGPDRRSRLGPSASARSGRSPSAPAAGTAVSSGSTRAATTPAITVGAASPLPHRIGTHLSVSLVSYFSSCGGVRPVSPKFRANSGMAPVTAA